MVTEALVSKKGRMAAFLPFVLNALSRHAANMLQRSLMLRITGDTNPALKELAG